MPELPEVENIKLGLEDSLKNASLYLEHKAANIGNLLNMRKI